MKSNYEEIMALKELLISRICEDGVEYKTEEVDKCRDKGYKY